MLRISQLAKKFNISRSTLLYYEKQELLSPTSRSSNGYRWYGKVEQKTLEMIINYRSFGISISEIKYLLTQNSKQQKILKKQFNRLENEIKKLRKQQFAIVSFLEKPELLESRGMNKSKWTEIMRASGMNDEDMLHWHAQFEKLRPAEHEEFLISLKISQNEIKQIRLRSGQTNK